MKKQIFRAVLIAATSVFLASFVLIMGVLYDYFSSVQMKGLETETYIATGAVEKNGKEYLESIKDGDYRITWIANDGTVLFDNKANETEMENHLEREEITEALKTYEPPVILCPKTFRRFTSSPFFHPSFPVGADT